MKKFKAILILLFCCSAAFSQKVYFMYLQSEGAQPFFLKMKEQVYSSNASGYLILSKLVDSTYTFAVGFPQNKWPEQTFNVSLGSQDRGFSLRNTDGKQWILADLQTQQVIQGQPTGKERSVKTEPKEVSPFTEALSKAANDPSLKERVIPQVAVAKIEEKPPVAIPAVKQETVPANPPPQEKKEEIAVQAKDTITQQPVLAAAVPATTLKKDEITEQVKDTAQAQPVVAIPPPEEKKTQPVEEKKQETVQVKEPVDTLSAVAPQQIEEKPAEKKEEQVQMPAPPVYKPSVVTRKTESSTSEGFGVTYIDAYPDGKKDTIQIFIPNPRVITRQVAPPQEETQFLPMDTEAKDLTPPKKPVSAANAGKNDCTAMASETDFLKLRKKMVATEGDDAMLAAAKKVFKTKCFTTEQVKNLGTLFLNDAGRYNFFDAAYLAVSDKENFAGLEVELKDAYYISRFKAMLR